jgi:hypothetical protein
MRKTATKTRTETTTKTEPAKGRTSTLFGSVATTAMVV